MCRNRRPRPWLRLRRSPGLRRRPRPPRIRLPSFANPTTTRIRTVGASSGPEKRWSVHHGCTQALLTHVCCEVWRGFQYLFDFFCPGGFQVLAKRQAELLNSPVDFLCPGGFQVLAKRQAEGDHRFLVALFIVSSGHLKIIQCIIQTI